MDTAEKRTAFRKKLKDLTQKELLQRAFLCNLIQKVDSEMACYGALFSDEDEDGSEDAFAADPQLAGIGLMLQQEMEKRSIAKAKVKLLDTEGENNDHANHEQTGSH